MTTGIQAKKSEHLPTIAKGAGIGFLGTVLGKSLIFIFAVIAARLLNPAQVGLYFLGIALINLAILPALLGLDIGVVRYAAIHSGKKAEEGVRNTILSSLVLALPLSLVVTVLVFFFSKEICVQLFHKPELTSIIKPLSLSIPFLVLATILLAGIQALKFMQYKVYAKEIAENLVKIGLFIVLYLTGLKLFGLLIATIIASIVSATLSFYYLNKLIPLLNFKQTPDWEFKKLLSFSIPQSFSNLLIIGTLNADILILGLFANAKAVGIYSIAAKASLLGFLILGAFNNIFAPIIADLDNQNQKPLLEELFKTITKWVFSLSFPLFILVTFLAKPILGTFSPEYQAGATSLIILSFGQLVNSAAGPVGLMIVMSGKPTIELVANIATFAINMFLNFLLIPRMGITGAAIATASAISIVNIFRLIAVYIIMGIHPFKASYLKPALAGTVAAIVVFFGVGAWFKETSLLLPIFLAATFVLGYTALMVRLGVEQEDQLIIKAVGKKLPLIRA